DGSTKPTDHLSINSNLAIDQASLEPTNLTLSFQIKNLDLFNYQSPKIPLFSYGVPGLASLDIDLQFFIDIFLNAGVTLALDPQLLSSNDPLNHVLPVVFAIPTFITPSAKIAA